jgi:hypothetical protein
VCALVVSSWPGSVLRSPHLPLEPQLPELGPGADRDAALVVRVVAQQSPVAGARVRCLAMVDGRAFLAAEGRSDASGTLRLDRLPRGEHWLLVESESFARASTSLVLFSGERRLTMELVPEHALSVEVKDDDGKPIADAEVEVTGDDPLPVGARTGSDGVAQVRRLAGTKWLVVARARGFEEVAQRGVKEGDRPKLVLRRLGAFLVTVVGADGAPAKGARVHIAGASLWPPRMADVKEDGTVRIGSLAAGTYALRATLGQSASPIEFGASVGRGEEKAVTLKLAPGVVVDVRVTDGEGDPATPIAGARVTLTEGGVSPFPIEGTTDASGRARLGPVAPAFLSVAARADGFVPRGAVAVPDPPRGELRVALARAGVLSGRVVDARGFPVDGASLQVVGTDYQGAPIDEDPRRSRFRDAHFAMALEGPRPLIPAGELGVMPGPVPPIPHAFSLSPQLPASLAPAAPEEPWVTRGDGTFRAAPVSPGRVRALVRHPQYIEAQSDVVALTSGAEAKVEIVMRAGGSLEGRVVDRLGRAVGGAHVSIAATHGSMERATRAATDGTFAFAAVPDQVTLMVARPDEPLDVATRLEVEVAEGARKTVEVTLPDPRPPLPVRVVDDRGYALDAVQISATSLEPAVPLRTTAFTNARGEASIPGGRGIHARLEVIAPGFAARALLTEPTTEELRVELHAAERLTGEIRTDRGDPVKNATIALYTDLGPRHGRGDAAGLFAFSDLAPGHARLRVRAPGFAPATREIEIEAHAGKRPTIVPRVELSPEGAVEGTVVDARGEPVQGARVAKDLVPVYLAVGAVPAGVAVTDAKGHFRLAELAEGSIDVEAYAADVGRGRAEAVRVTAGRTNDGVRIQLKADGERTKESSARGGVAITLGESAGEAREVVVVAVAEGSEAERAGLVPGDVLLEVDGAAVQSMSQARAKLSGALADDVVVKLRRNGHTLGLRVPREQVHR